MKTFLEYMFFLGGSIVMWAKLGSVVLALGVLSYMCYAFNRMLERGKLLQGT